MPRKGKKLPLVLERHEVEALKKAPNTRCPTGLRNRAVIELLHGAGLRISEVVSLKPAHINWQASVIEVHQGKGSRDRNVPVGGDTLGWLRAWTLPILSRSYWGRKRSRSFATREWIRVS